MRRKYGRASSCAGECFYSRVRTLVRPVIPKQSFGVYSSFDFMEIPGEGRCCTYCACCTSEGAYGFTFLSWKQYPYFGSPGMY